MKKYRIIGLFTLFITLSLNTFAQNSILWKVYGNGLKDTSYVYGTIHIQDKRVFKFDETVINKIEECENLATEISFDSIDPMALMQYVMMKGDTTLKTLYTPAEYILVDELFKEQMGMDLTMFMKMKPIAIISSMQEKGETGEMGMPLDIYLSEVAKKKGKSTSGIESVEEQLQALDVIPLKEQAKLLLEMLASDESVDDQTEELITLYLEQDIKGLLNLIQEYSNNGDFEQVLIVDRNHKMAERIIKNGKEKSSFNAVGAGHLAGEEGVLNLIKQKGYKVEAIKFNFSI